MAFCFFGNISAINPPTITRILKMWNKIVFVNTYNKIKFSWMRSKHEPKFYGDLIVNTIITFAKPGKVSRSDW